MDGRRGLIRMAFLYSVPFEMEKWMIREGDFVPLPTHVLSQKPKQRH